MERRTGVIAGIDLKDYIEKGRLSFDPPLDQFQMHDNAVAVDLRLGYTFKIPLEARRTPRGREAIGPEDNNDYFDIIELEPGQFFDILPGERIHGYSLDKITMSDDTLAIELPRSGTNRRGLEVGPTGLIDPDYEGHLLIPISNHSRRAQRLYPGIRFCQIFFMDLTRPVQARRSRWHNTDAIVSRKPERDAIEEALIKAGDLKRLKSDYPFISHT